MPIVLIAVDRRGAKTRISSASFDAPADTADADDNANSYRAKSHQRVGSLTARGPRNRRPAMRVSAR